jgi:hypothetical protein
LATPTPPQPARLMTFSASRNVKSCSLGTLGCILPGQVKSPSPTRRASLGARIRGCHSPGLSSDCYSGNRGLVRAVSANSSSGSARSSSNTPTLLRTLSGLSAAEAALAASALPGAIADEELSSPCRGRRKRREGSGGAKRSTIIVHGVIAYPGDGVISYPGDLLQLGQSGSPPPWERPRSCDDVDRLIARCMTHERPTALVQASVVLLDSCIVKLGEKGPAGEKRSDRIRLMLRLTEELRRYNADLTEHASSRVPSKDESGSPR